MVTTNVSANWNVSGVWGDVSSANASTISDFTIGVIGTIDPNLSGSINSPALITSPTQAASAYGKTSDLYTIYNAFYSQAPTFEVYAIPVADYTSANIISGIQALKGQKVDYIVSNIGSLLTVTDGTPDVADLQSAIAAVETAISPRATWYSSLFGFHITAAIGTVDQLVAAGKVLNSKFSTVVGFPSGSPDSTAVLAGYACAPSALKAAASPATPQQGIEVAAQATPNTADTFEPNDRNTLYNNGISATYQKGGNVYIDTLRTTYQTDLNGDLDDSYADVETMFTNAYIVTDLKSYLSSSNMGANSKILIDDGASFPISGTANVTTPNTVKAQIATRMATYASTFLIENEEEDSKNIVVERNGNKLNCYIPYTISGKLRSINFITSFKLS